MTLLFLLVCFLSCFAVKSTAQNCHLDLRKILSVTSNSTCGDTPPYQCSTPIPHNPNLVLDGNNATWWESANGEQPVRMSFSSDTLSNFVLTALDFKFQNSLPQSIGVYLEDSKTPLSYFSTNCTASGPINCQQYNITKENEGSITVSLLTMEVSVMNLHVFFYGFQNNSTHYEVQNVYVQGYITSGQYLPGPHNPRFEGESGSLVNPVNSIAVGSDANIFPNYSGQGYAVLNFTEILFQQLQLTLEITTNTSYNNIVLRYQNNDLQGLQMPAVIVQGNKLCNVRFYIQSKHLCPQNCYSRASAIDNECPTFESGTVSVIAQVGWANFLLDYITAIPDSVSPEPFATNCNLSTNSLSQDCICQFLQLSLELHCSTKDCLCSQEHSNSSICAVYDGQCSCQASDSQLVDPVGRQCYNCPFYYYITNGGCSKCGCPDDSPCELNGQCNCGPYIRGRTCDTCISGTYGDPLSNIACQNCTCDHYGTLECNHTTGECICQPNVVGMDCSDCKAGFYNLSSFGCQSCGCSKEGSMDIQCDDNGVCNCHIGYTGDKCDKCLNEYYMSPEGCVACNCSAHSNQCSQRPNITNYPHELCVCPPEYTGDSCQYCSDNHYQMNNNTCVPCNCNNSLVCNNMTGQCLYFPVPPPPVTFPPPPPPLNCTPNTTGDLCDQCADGYYNATINLSDLICLPCPCHSNTSYNGSCIVINMEPACFCLPGHEGSLCDLCLAGYYGLPPTYPCSTCQCSGNIDPNDQNACNHTTGECLLCLNNSTGPNCELCLDGFFGDAVAQSCEPCDCYTGGSVDNICNKSSGLCSCLSGVEGIKCDMCKVDHWNFQYGVGCSHCNCNAIGSNSSECNVFSGQCSCQPGVTGRTCDSCLIGFFNFSSLGCQNCGCGNGSLNVSCHHDSGQCYCANGATGTKCDSCLAYYQMTIEGCSNCDDCVQSLKYMNDEAENNLTLIDELAKQAASLQASDTLNINVLKNEIDHLWANFNATNAELSIIQGQFDSLVYLVNDTKLSLKSLSEQTVDLLYNATNSIPKADQVFNQANSLYNSLEFDFVETRDTMNFLNLLRQRMMILETNFSLVLSNISQSIANLLAQSLNNESTNLQNIVSSVLNTRIYANSKYSQAVVESSYISLQLSNLYALDSKRTALTSTINQLVTDVNSIKIDLYDSQSVATNLSVASSAVNKTIDEASILINETETTLASVAGILSLASWNIENLTKLLNNPYQHGSFSGSGSGSASDHLISSTFFEHLILLNSSVYQLQATLAMNTSTFDGALSHHNNIINQAQNVCSILSVSILVGNDAVAAIIDYTLVNDTLVKAESLVRMANTTLTTVLKELDSLTSDSLNNNASDALEKAKGLVVEVNILEARLQDLNEMYISLMQQEQAVSDNIQDLINSINLLIMRYNQLISTEASTASSVSIALSNTDGYIQIANSTYIAMMTALADLTTIVNNVTEQLMDLNADVVIIENEAIETNITVAESQKEFNEKVSILNDTITTETLLTNELTLAKVNMDDLMQQLTEAQNAVALIDIALRFHGNSTASYDLTSTDHQDNHVSMYFRPDNPSGVLLSDGSSSLQLMDGQVKWSNGHNQIQTGLLPLSSTKWYQVLASSEGFSMFLSIASLQNATDMTVTVMEQTNSSSLPLNQTISLAGYNNGSYYSGCIDRVIVNGKMVPLLLPDSTSDPLSTCGPRPASDSIETEVGAWFQGQSHLILQPVFFSDGYLSYSFLLRTFANSALVTQLHNSAMQRIILYINNSVPHVLLTLGNIDVQLLSSSVYVSDGDWHEISVNIHGNICELSVDGNTDTLSLIFPAKNLTSPVNFTLGGQSNLNIPSFAGCLSNMYIENNNINLSLSEEVKRVQLSICPSYVIPGTRFMGNGYAVFPIVDFVSSLSLSFRTEQLSAVLVYMSAPVSSNGMSVLPDRLIMTMFHAYIRIDYRNTFNNVTLTSQQTNLNDGLWHNVSISLGQNNLVLNVDGELSVTEDVKNNTNKLLMMGEITVGGLPSNYLAPVPAIDHFRGCLKDLHINQQYYDFNDATLSEGVALYGCHGDAPQPSPTASSFISSSTYFIGFGSGSGEHFYSSSGSLVTDVSDTITSTPTIVLDTVTPPATETTSVSDIIITLTPTETTSVSDTITLTPTETISVLDTITLTPTETTSVSDTITLTTTSVSDTITLTPTETISVPTETISVLDTITLTPTETTSVSDTITLTPTETTNVSDTITLTTTETISVPTETTSISDTITLTPTETISVPTETTSVSDTITLTPTETTSLSDTITLTPTETTSVSDIITLTPTETISVPTETTSVSDTITLTPTETISVPTETTSVSDTITLKPTETTSVSDIITLTPTETISVSDTITLTPTETISVPTETTSVSDTITLTPTETISVPTETTSVSDTITLTPTETTSVLDTIFFTPTETMSVSDIITSISTETTTVSDTITPTPTETSNTITLTPTETIGVSDTFTPASTETTSVSVTTDSPSPTSTPLLATGLDGRKDGFLSYSISTEEIYYSLNMTLVFRTVSSDALLIYTQGSTHVDYLALELRNGLLYYSYNLGAGQIFISSTPSQTRYDDDTIHTVTIWRDNTLGRLIANGNEYSGSSPSGYIALNTDNNPLYVGGVSQGSSVSSLYKDRTKAPPGALACFYSLEINNQQIDLRNVLASNGLMSCQDSYNDHISFPGDGYARIVDVYNPRIKYGFYLEFRTLQSSGLLLYSASLFHEDHTALEISNGTVRFIFDNGDGVGIVKYSPTNSFELFDGNWHTILATKDMLTGTLIVDGGAAVTAMLSNSAFVAVNIESPLYAGGVPDNVLVRYTVKSGAFHGCMRNVQLLDSTGVGSNIHFSEAIISPSVQLYTCIL